jgi:dTDP-4-dehydrorhamnose reductase
MKILITGDAGFVGRAFRRHLDSKINTIVGVDLVNGLDCRDFFRKDNTIVSSFMLFNIISSRSKPYLIHQCVKSAGIFCPALCLAILRIMSFSCK